MLTANSNWFRFYGIFKKWLIDEKGEGPVKYYICLNNFCLK